MSQFQLGADVSISARHFAKNADFPDHHGSIIDIDEDAQRILVRYDARGDGSDDGLEEWYPMSDFTITE